MLLKSSRLGEIEIDDKQVIDFPDGIPGFESEKKFAIFSLAPDAPFYYMHSVQSPDLCLVLAVPFMFFPDYAVDLPQEELGKLAAEEDAKGLAVFVVLTIPDDFRDTTANLLAPVVVNLDKQKGVQYVPVQSPYSTRHRLFNPQEPKKAASAGQGL
ncbi:flagellar assembly protein FliW [Syntrophothermus lipocalidus]|uniref:Flagellar assembly factor FliW n=1 Tax=Syntrophothermus lipocalidus (strain DSM 12680 / TGB-C1) TaxID=643648 RepID=D7CPM4_SYNLT|nr:flagellar assembly protein FliW [Syntrophothermus lipocalidus]ADI02659.1 protein of unknown function DUF180 [Syntrophothermus lipocalidus DSM 12680]